MDLNHDKQIQSLLCYRYTIGQTGALKVECPRVESSIGVKALKRENVRTWRPWQEHPMLDVLTF